MNKTILITGCSSGIGYDAAHYFHANGYTVFATARQSKDVEHLQKEGLNAYLLDVTKPQTITDTLDAILKETGGTLYALFNNAGYGQPGALEDVATDVLREQFETNVFGLHEMTRRIIPIMRAQGYGRIIQHSSILGIISLRFRGAYNASKYAVEGLCDTLRLELDNTDIYVSTLNTGPVRSKFRDNGIKKFLENIDGENSVFADEYKRDVLKREEKKDKDGLFTRNSDAVIEKIIHALEHPNPKARYYITPATHLLGSFKRILSTKMLDRILMKV